MRHASTRHAGAASNRSIVMCAGAGFVRKGWRGSRASELGQGQAWLVVLKAKPTIGNALCVCVRARARELKTNLKTTETRPVGDLENFLLKKCEFRSKSFAHF